MASDLIIDETICDSPDSVCIDCVDPCKHLSLGDAPAVCQHLATNILCNPCTQN
jgi:hypothetical protein